VAGETHHRLEMQGIVRRFPGGAGVQDVSFTVAPGEIVCLLGPSGCGKSTTLRIAAGVERASAGRVLIDGKQMQAPGCWVPPERRNVGLMFQDYALFPHLTVLGNVMFGLDNLPRAQAKEISMTALTRVGLGHLGNAYPHVLSGGEQQRVALARAMAPGPKLMLMDEPFSGLDERLRDEVRESTLNVLSDAGASALIVTHDPEEAMAIASRIVLLRAGRVLQDATPDTVYAEPIDEAAAAFFSSHVALKGVTQNGAVETPLGALASMHADGTKVSVLVRPESIQFRESGVTARVTRIRKIGPDVQISLEVQGASGPVNLRARARMERPPAFGTMVKIALDPLRTLMLKEN
jgi:iron(III) transport system ATP-binding protein